MQVILDYVTCQKYTNVKICIISPKIVTAKQVVLTRIDFMAKHGSD